MILITLGTIPYSFDRLIDWMAISLNEGLICEPVFVQHGITNVKAITNNPLVATSSLLSLDEISKVIAKSRLVISHAGQGTTRKLARTDKPFIIVPRESKYKEHIDDHQLCFAQNMSNKFGICCCTSLIDFQEFILNPPKPINKELFHEARLADHLLTIFPPNYQNNRKPAKNNLLNKHKKAV